MHIGQKGIVITSKTVMVAKLKLLSSDSRMYQLCRVRRGPVCYERMRDDERMPRQSDIKAKQHAKPFAARVRALLQSLATAFRGQLLLIPTLAGGNPPSDDGTTGTVGGVLRRATIRLPTTNYRRRRSIQSPKRSDIAACQSGSSITRYKFRPERVDTSGGFKKKLTVQNESIG